MKLVKFSLAGLLASLFENGAKAKGGGDRILVQIVLQVVRPPR